MPCSNCVCVCVCVCARARGTQLRMVAYLIYLSFRNLNMLVAQYFIHMKHTQTQALYTFFMSSSSTGVDVLPGVAPKYLAEFIDCKRFFFRYHLFRTVQFPKVHRNYKIQYNSMKILFIFYSLTSMVCESAHECVYLAIARFRDR